MDAETLLARLAAAFPSEPVPDRDALFNGHCCECVEVSEAFGYKPWPAITLDELRAGRETALLTATAWRYYLPAVIAWCIREPNVVDVIEDNLVYQLEPPEPSDDPPLHEWFWQRAVGFSEGQRLVILDYLNWYRQRLEADWRPFKAKPPQHVYRALAHWTVNAAPPRGDDAR